MRAEIVPMMLSLAIASSIASAQAGAMRTGSFPSEYRGDAFVTLHGSHTRPERTGYKVVRVRMKDGKTTGKCEAFMTEFIIDNDSAWGRPAAVTVTRDGAPLVIDDANGTIYRFTHQ
ncbi:MAG: hypothetical protein ABIT36_02540 [Steroidobacteraceae bacterium]